MQLPEDDMNKCFKRLTVALRDHVFLLKLSQRIFDMSISILEDLEREHFSARTHSTRRRNKLCSSPILAILSLQNYWLFSQFKGDMQTICADRGFPKHAQGLA